MCGAGAFSCGMGDGTNDMAKLTTNYILLAISKEKDIKDI